MVETAPHREATGAADAAQAPALQVSGLVKSFGERPILRRLDLTVEWGQRYVLFGGNGSGKTTLLKTLAGLARPDEGAIHVAGLDARKQGARLRRYLGVVTHQPLLYDELTGVENLRFYGRMYRLRDIDARIQAAAAQMNAGRFLSYRVRTLSHGMKKRLSIARALLHDPPILLLDEPETGLDEEAIGLLGSAILGEGSTPRTVLLTTHSLERGLALGDRIGILARGRIVAEDAAGDVTIAALRDRFREYLEMTP